MTVIFPIYLKILNNSCFFFDFYGRTRLLFLSKGTYFATDDGLTSLTDSH